MDKESSHAREREIDRGREDVWGREISLERERRREQDFVKERQGEGERKGEGQRENARARDRERKTSAYCIRTSPHTTYTHLTSNKHTPFTKYTQIYKDSAHAHKHIRVCPRRVVELMSASNCSSRCTASGVDRNWHAWWKGVFPFRFPKLMIARASSREKEQRYCLRFSTGCSRSFTHISRSFTALGSFSFSSTISSLFLIIMCTHTLECEGTLNTLS